MSSMELDLTPGQRRSLETILRVFLETKAWPIYAYIESVLDEIEIDFAEEFATMQPGLVWPMPTAAAHRPDQEIGLTLLGATHCRGTEPIIDMFLRGIQWAVRVRSAVKPDPHQYVEHEWRFADYIGGVRRGASDVPLAIAMLSIRLMEHEPDLIRWGGPPGDALNWTLTIPSGIKRYRNCTTFEEYWQRRTEATSPAIPQPVLHLPGRPVNSPATPQLSSLHPDIQRASAKLFSDGHYASAILEAFKAIIIRVKVLSRLPGDGKSLMSRAFSGAEPAIRLNAGADQVDRDEQEGFMHIFMGAAQGVRNPKAHALSQDMEKDSAFEYLALASLLMRRLDDAQNLRSSISESEPD